MGNILGALYLSMLFLGIINSRTVQPVAAAERAVRPSVLYPILQRTPVLIFSRFGMLNAAWQSCPLLKKFHSLWIFGIS